MQVRPETYVYKQVAGCQIKADVYRRAASLEPAPAIVFIHGGCLMYGSRKGLHPRQLERYLLAGYTVASVDYRLAPESKLPDIIEDLRDAVRWVREGGTGLFSVDPHRLAVVGHSAGGYLALMAGHVVLPRPQALVVFYGYGDIVGDWYGKPDPFYLQKPLVSEEESGRNVQGPIVSEPNESRGKDKLYLYYRQKGLWPLEVAGHSPKTEPAFFVPYCPLHNVSAAYPPTMLLHGDQDTDVPYEQSVLMAAELSRHGVEHELVTIQGGSHGFDRDMEDPVVRDTFTRVLAFLDRHIGRKAEA
jgi:acetyl esterase/lipase